MHYKDYSSITVYEWRLLKTLNGFGIPKYLLMTKFKGWDRKKNQETDMLWSAFLIHEMAYPGKEIQFPELFMDEESVVQVMKRAYDTAQIEGINFYHIQPQETTGVVKRIILSTIVYLGKEYLLKHSRTIDAYEIMGYQLIAWLKDEGHRYAQPAICNNPQWTYLWEEPAPTCKVVELEFMDKQEETFERQNRKHLHREESGRESEGYLITLQTPKWEKYVSGIRSLSSKSPGLCLTPNRTMAVTFAREDEALASIVSLSEGFFPYESFEIIQYPVLPGEAKIHPIAVLKD